MLEQILQIYEDEELLIADGFDTAIIGVDEKSFKLIYSVSKCIEILMEEMTMEEAIEHFEFNISGAYIGDKTPIWCWDNF